MNRSRTFGDAAMKARFNSCALFQCSMRCSSVFWSSAESKVFESALVVFWLVQNEPRFSLVLGLRAVSSCTFASCASSVFSAATLRSFERFLSRPAFRIASLASGNAIDLKRTFDVLPLRCLSLTFDGQFARRLRDAALPAAWSLFLDILTRKCWIDFQQLDPFSDQFVVLQWRRIGAMQILGYLPHSRHALAALQDNARDRCPA
jgi:hypothetical protein